MAELEIDEEQDSATYLNLIREKIKIVDPRIPQIYLSEETNCALARVIENPKFGIRLDRIKTIYLRGPSLWERLTSYQGDIKCGYCKTKRLIIDVEYLAHPPPGAKDLSLIYKIRKYLFFCPRCHSSNSSWP